MSDKEKDAEWKVAFVYVLIFTFCLFVLALFMSIAPPISKITHSFAMFLSSSILIELLFLWGIIFGAAKFINGRYVIKNKLRIIRFSTIYLAIIAVFLSAYPIFTTIVYSSAAGVFMEGLREIFEYLLLIIGLIVIFYWISKIHIKEDQEKSSS